MRIVLDPTKKKEEQERIAKECKVTTKTVRNALSCRTHGPKANMIRKNALEHGAIEWPEGK